MDLRWSGFGREREQLAFGKVESEMLIIYPDNEGEEERRERAGYHSSGKKNHERNNSQGILCNWRTGWNQVIIPGVLLPKVSVFTERVASPCPTCPW